MDVITYALCKNYIDSKTRDNNSRYNYRQFLVGEPTEEQYNEIKYGYTGELHIGDYWYIGDNKYIIADFDYFRYTGDNNFTARHAIVIPDFSNYNSSMETTLTTNNGYKNASIRTNSVMESLKATIINDFGENHILSYRSNMVSTCEGGIPVQEEWSDAKIELLSEQMLYGSKICGYQSIGADFRISPIEKTQLALFRYCPWYINYFKNFWLRDVASSTHFCCVQNGRASWAAATNSLKIVPFFLVS